MKTSYKMTFSSPTHGTFNLGNARGIREARQMAADAIDRYVPYAGTIYRDRHSDSETVWAARNTDAAVYAERAR